jgi:hypothetical protein
MVDLFQHNLILVDSQVYMHYFFQSLQLLLSHDFLFHWHIAVLDFIRQQHVDLFIIYDFVGLAFHFL